MDRKSRGPEVTWTGSHVDRKSRGPEVTWTGSHVDRKSRGPEVTWTGSHVDRHTPPHEASVRGSSWRVPAGINVRQYRSKKYKRNYANADVFSRLKYGGRQPGGRPLLPPA